MKKHIPVSKAKIYIYNSIEFEPKDKVMQMRNCNPITLAINISLKRILPLYMADFGF